METMLGTIQQADICSSEKESYTNIFFSIEEKRNDKKNAQRKFDTKQASPETF